MKKWALETCCALLIVGGTVAVVLPAVDPPPSNCGGNSLALYQCNQFAFAAHVETLLKDSQQFDARTAILRPDSLLASGWSPFDDKSTFVVRPTFSIAGDSPRRIVIVSTVAHDNVPQPTIWNGYRRNPAHAVGYSDGTSGLITPAEFAALDVSAFVRADELFASAAPHTIDSVSPTTPGLN